MLINPFIPHLRNHPYNNLTALYKEDDDVLGEVMTAIPEHLEASLEGYSLRDVLKAALCNVGHINHIGPERNKALHHARYSIQRILITNQLRNTTDISKLKTAEMMVTNAQKAMLAPSRISNYISLISAGIEQWTLVVPSEWYRFQEAVIERFDVIDTHLFDLHVDKTFEEKEKEVQDSHDAVLKTGNDLIAKLPEYMEQTIGHVRALCELRYGRF